MEATDAAERISDLRDLLAAAAVGNRFAIVDRETWEEEWRAVPVERVKDKDGMRWWQLLDVLEWRWKQFTDKEYDHADPGFLVFGCEVDGGGVGGSGGI